MNSGYNDDLGIIANIIGFLAVSCLIMIS